MNPTTLFAGLIALAIWVAVARISSRGPLSWASPDSVFSTGLLLFYILPSIYWQFRPWSFWVPTYSEGLPMVLCSAALMGIPFLIANLSRSRQIAAPLPRLLRGVYSDQLLLLVIPIVLGVLWTINLVNHGWQGRLYHETPKLLGSESLAYLLGNISYYYPICYFALFALGDSFQRRVGTGFWIFDGLLQIFLLHRYAMLIFILRSGIFGLLLSWKPKLWKATLAAALGLIIISIVGASDPLVNLAAGGATSNHLSVTQVAEILSDTSMHYIQGNLDTPDASRGDNSVLRVLDDTMFRLHDARSASAIMLNIPETFPYFDGSTFAHILYALIPRILWPAKPSLRDIHLITTLVMPNDSGTNPTGTLAEFYMNFGFIGVFVGGIICMIITSWQTKKLSGQRITAIDICTYPLLAEQFFAANSNFSQRISEGFRFVLVYFIIKKLLVALKRRKGDSGFTQKHTGTIKANAHF